MKQALQQKIQLLRPGGTRSGGVKEANRLALDTVFFSELADAAGGVYDFLFSGIERMAFRANVDMQFLAER